ncbi:hypothetical protein EDD16DRAFT_1575003 [Pisolithus croceorrhizus]|nr:hypothetical protein EDD16DRAFT_1575003 [Pisolithus croceorrhizus]
MHSKLSTMTHSQLYPLEVNPATGEPFFRLPPPNGNIIVTPPRLSDAPYFAPILNDPRVGRWLEGPPIPYTDEHAAEWIEIITEQSQTILDKLKAEDTTRPGMALKLVDGCPVRHIREVLPDGTDVYVGDIDIRRGPFEEILDSEERRKQVEINESKALGDPSIVWTFGDYIAPSHHGRGIMSAAMRLILYSWAVPRMGVRCMSGYAFVGNIGSVRVFEKSGFVFKGILDNGKTVRGERRRLNYLEWIYEEQ